MRNRSCAGTPASAIVSAMILSAVRSFCACLRISTAAAVVFIFAIGSNAHGAPPAGSIAYVGTDSNIYYCDTTCAKPKCITCKAAAIHVRRDVRSKAGDARRQRPRRWPVARRHRVRMADVLARRQAHRVFVRDAQASRRFVRGVGLRSRAQPGDADIREPIRAHRLPGLDARRTAPFISARRAARTQPGAGRGQGIDAGQNRHHRDAAVLRLGHAAATRLRCIRLRSTRNAPSRFR